MEFLGASFQEFVGGTHKDLKYSVLLAQGCTKGQVVNAFYADPTNSVAASQFRCLNTKAPQGDK